MTTVEIPVISGMHAVNAPLRTLRAAFTVSDLSQPRHPQPNSHPEMLSYSDILRTNAAIRERLRAYNQSAMIPPEQQSALRRFGANISSFVHLLLRRPAYPKDWKHAVEQFLHPSTKSPASKKPYIYPASPENALSVGRDIPRRLHVSGNTSSLLLPLPQGNASRHPIDYTHYRPQRRPQSYQYTPPGYNPLHRDIPSAIPPHVISYVTTQIETRKQQDELFMLEMRAKLALIEQKGRDQEALLDESARRLKASLSFFERIPIPSGKRWNEPASSLPQLMYA